MIDKQRLEEKCSTWNIAPVSYTHLDVYKRQLFFCFTFPLAFSLYYVISNIVMTAQTQVMRKFYDPEKMRKMCIRDSFWA